MRKEPSSAHLKGKTRIFLTVLIVGMVAYLVSNADAKSVLASVSFVCEKNSPRNIPTVTAWSYPKGLSKSDMTPGQGLTLSSVVNPGIPHNGEDYGNHPAGFEIFAVADGWVACSYSSTDDRDLGNAVFVESVLPDGKHVTTLYGHLSNKDLIPTNSYVTRGQTRIGKLGTTAENGNWPVHLHLGIRDGFVIGREDSWPNQCWGYLFKRDSSRPGCPENPSDEFKRWHSLSTWAETLPATIQNWIVESKNLNSTLPWWRTFFVCDDRRIKVSLDGNLIFHTSAQDGANPSQSARVFVWPGSHTLKTELFEYPSAKSVLVDSVLFPLEPACASEPSSSTPEQPVRIFFDTLTRDDLDTTLNQCFAPQHRPIAKPLLETFRSMRKNQGLNLSFSNLSYKTTSYDGQKGMVKVTGIATSRSKDGTQNRYSFDIDVPVFLFLNTWYIDLDIQRLQQLLEQMSR
jgi:murein DD-endopeptidase MepM/ murein hydrolase activator NlpD